MSITLRSFVDVKHAGIADELEFLHPAIQGYLWSLAFYCATSGYRAPLVTHAIRTEDQMATFYGADWKRRGKFSWHLVRRAIDLRSWQWEADQLQDIINWTRDNFPGFEVVFHDVGFGEHLHVAAPAPLAMLRNLKRWLTKRGEAKSGRMTPAS